MSWADRVIVAPVTSQGMGRIYPFEVLVPAGEAGLTAAELRKAVAMSSARALGVVRSS